MASTNAKRSRKWRLKNLGYWRNWRAKIRKKDPKWESRRYKRQTAKNPNWQRIAYLKHAYGLTLLEYQTMLNTQKSCCALCRKPFTDQVMKTASIDHCHKTGKVRALLHRDCNAMLGIAEDSVKRLTQAIIYLKAFH